MKQASKASGSICAYTVVSILCLTLSDKLMERYTLNTSFLIQLQAYKGYIYIFLTLLFLIRILKIETKRYEKLTTCLQIENQILLQDNEDLNLRLKAKTNMAKELEHYATKDELTGLFNRRKGIELFKSELESARVNKTNLLVCFIDIDGLKNVNDRLGHDAGDSLIRTVAQLLSDNVSEKDILCRLGGDEFLIIFPKATRKEIDIIRKRIDFSVNTYNKAGKAKYAIGFSLGFSEYDYRENKAIDELIKCADKMMYEEKSVRKMAFVKRGGIVAGRF